MLRLEALSRIHKFFVDSVEFDKSVDVSCLKLFEGNKVFVLWKWCLLTDSENSQVEDSDLDTELTNEKMDDEDNTSEEQSDDHASTAVYTITFKCVGTTKEQRYQDVLARAAHEKRNGRDVKVKITPEPQNPFDAKTIAFELQVDNQRERVGYMVRDVLGTVHLALHNDDKLSVDQDWVKFITHWCRSCPGWYCGIKISKTGSWSSEVMRCRSTI